MTSSDRIVVPRTFTYPDISPNRLRSPVDSVPTLQIRRVDRRDYRVVRRDRRPY